MAVILHTYDYPTLRAFVQHQKASEEIVETLDTYIEVLIGAIGDNVQGFETLPRATIKTMYCLLSGNMYLESEPKKRINGLKLQCIVTLPDKAAFTGTAYFTLDENQNIGGVVDEEEVLEWFGLA